MSAATFNDHRLLERPFQVDGPEVFNALALDLFHLHATRNPVYRGFLKGLRLDPTMVDRAESIPFLPIGVFRNHRVLLDGLDPSSFFTSSCTSSRASKGYHSAYTPVANFLRANCSEASAVA